MIVRLTSADLHVNIALWNVEARWLAVADVAGDKDIGLASCRRAAMAAALASFGSDAAGRLLANLPHRMRPDATD